jgi:hypothetical protein
MTGERARSVKESHSVRRGKASSPSQSVDSSDSLRVARILVPDLAML